MTTVTITSEFIKLDQFLKLADITGSGGEARSFILENEILVNGEIEARRGKKLRHGDKVSVKGLTFQIKKDGEKSDD